MQFRDVRSAANRQEHAPVLPQARNGQRIDSQPTGDEVVFDDIPGVLPASRCAADSTGVLTGRARGKKWRELPKYLTSQTGIRLALAEQELTQAVKVLESRPGFARMELWLRDQMEQAEQEGPAESKYFGTTARAELALKWFDIRAEAFARLVTNVDTQNAFIIIVARAQREAWRDFTGHYPELLYPVSIEFCEVVERIHRRAQNWIRKGYERLALLEELPVGDEAGPPNAGPDDGRVSNTDASIHQAERGPKRQGKAKRSERHTLVKAFIEKLARAGRKINRTVIWRAAGYTNRSQFEHWQRNDPRTGQTATGNFNRILGLSPEDFILLLEKRVR